MHRVHQILSATVLTCGAFLLVAAEGEPKGGSISADSSYNASRSFAQPVREDPVGLGITRDRAFWGAPPPMPHSFADERSNDCLACHARENRIDKQQQSIVPVPHPEYTSCQQCHVDASNADVLVFRENLFVGLDYPGKGTRAHPYAPPTIPHKTFMRDNCLSCHGPSGKQRIASPHPYRSQCQQCHVSDASKNYDRPIPWSELDGSL